MRLMRAVSGHADSELRIRSVQVQDSDIAGRISPGLIVITLLSAESLEASPVIFGAIAIPTTRILIGFPF
jgi:hypothetical protein